MPYELSCPSCGAVVQSPFVRVGAVVACGSCSHKYRIANEQVKRKVAAAGPGSLGVAGDVADGGDEPSTEELVRQAADGHVVGLSGLSEMMRQESASPAIHRSSPAPPAGRAVAGSSGYSGGAARRQARRRNSRLLYSLFGGLVLIMAGIGVAMWWAMMSGGLVTELPPPPPPERKPVVREPSPYEALPLLYAQPLELSPWRPVDDSFTPPVPPVPPASPASPTGSASSAYSDAWVVDEARVFTGSEEHYTASIVTDSRDIAAAATLHVVLMDTEDRALVQAQSPVALFGGGRRQGVRVALPQGLPDGLVRVKTWVTIEDQLEGGTYLPQAEIAALPDDVAGDQRIAVTNTADEPMDRLVVVLTALDGRDRPKRRWRVEAAGPIDPGDHAEFRVVLPRHDGTAARWEILAAGASPDPE